MVCEFRIKRVDGKKEIAMKRYTIPERDLKSQSVPVHRFSEPKNQAKRYKMAEMKGLRGYVRTRGGTARPDQMPRHVSTASPRPVHGAVMWHDEWSKAIASGGRSATLSKKAKELWENYGVTPHYTIPMYEASEFEADKTYRLHMPYTVVVARERKVGGKTYWEILDSKQGAVVLSVSGRALTEIPNKMTRDDDFAPVIKSIK